MKLRKNVIDVITKAIGGGEISVNVRQDEIRIKVPESSDFDNVWSLIEKINIEQKKMTTYEDFNTEHSKKSLKQLIVNGDETERIWIASLNEKIIGMININYQRSDYLFFDDKYVFIKYVYVEEGMEECLQMLFDTVITDAKQYGFEYICTDVKVGDARVDKLLQDNSFEDFRFRLAKEL